MYKRHVLKKYPHAYAAQDIDGYWHIWCPSVRGALSGGRLMTRSATTAWKYAMARLWRITPELSGGNRPLEWVVMHQKH